MKKYKGSLWADEGNYDYFRTMLKKHGASQIKGKEPEEEYEFYYVFLTFKASISAVRRILLDLNSIDKITIKNFPTSKLINLSHFSNMKIIHHSEFNPMLHFSEDSRIGWHVSIDIYYYLAVYSQDKKKWNEAIQESEYASAEYVSMNENIIRLYGYNTIPELFSLLTKNKDLNWQPTYYINNPEILETISYASLKTCLYAHKNHLCFMTCNEHHNNIYLQLLNELKRTSTSDIHDRLEYHNQSVPL
jgi:hypothetical protein